MAELILLEKLLETTYTLLANAWDISVEKLLPLVEDAITHLDMNSENVQQTMEHIQQTVQQGGETIVNDMIENPDEIFDNVVNTDNALRAGMAISFLNTLKKKVQNYQNKNKNLTERVSNLEIHVQPIVFRRCNEMVRGRFSRTRCKNKLYTDLKIL